MTPEYFLTTGYVMATHSIAVKTKGSIRTREETSFGVGPYEGTFTILNNRDQLIFSIDFGSHSVIANRNSQRQYEWTRAPSSSDMVALALIGIAQSE